jgi:putative ATPase
VARRAAGAAPVPLFTPPDRLRPLADRMRPRSLDEVVGQDALLGPGAALRRLVEGGRLPSCILWGPPGSGKTTIGRLLAEAIGARFAALNSTTDGVATLRGVVEEARSAAALEGRTTVVFLDEVHRYSKAQQDSLLPHVEAGTIVLVGATTEPPIAGGITPPLLSRLRVFRLQPLGETDLATIASRALADPTLGLAGAYTLDETASRQLIGYASGDARRMLGLLETAALLAERRAVDAAADADGKDAAGEASAGEASGDEAGEAPGGQPPDGAPGPVARPVARPVLVESADIARAAQSPMLGYDRSGVISALIKSIRGSDPDAALWWLATALESGEDPRYLARRLVISASEDVGNAEPAGLPLAVAALTAVEKIGAETNDEGLYALAQTAVFLAASPKSAAAGRAFFATRDELRAHGPRPVPGHLRPAAKTYRNPHDAAGAAADQAYLPRGVAGRQFWEPTEAGAESRLRELHLARLDAKAEARRRRSE